MTAHTLVTGATGFVGSAVARTLLERGHTLRLMVREGSDRRNIADIPAELVEGDLSRPDTFARAVEGCRYVFHVAADYRLWVPDPAPMMTANVEGTRLLMLAAQKAGVERIVYCSSVAALGLIGDGTESDEATPVHEHGVIGIYKRSKYRAEQEVLQLVKEQGLPAVIVNPSTPVGPRDIKPTPTGQMILDCAAGRMPAYVDTGVNIVHVDDVAEGHALALERGTIGEKYILGGENFLLRDLFAMVSEIAHVPPPRISCRRKLSGRWRSLPSGCPAPLVFPPASRGRCWPCPARKCSSPRTRPSGIWVTAPAPPGRPLRTPSHGSVTTVC